MSTSESLALSEAQTARCLGISVSGLRRWRRDGQGPPFIRMGRLIRYDESDLGQWLEANKIRGTSEAKEES